MSVEAFVDTNVLIYAATGHADAPAKHARAWDIIGPGKYAISAQVLGEFYVNVTRKTAELLSHEEAARWIDRLRTITVAPVDHELVASAVTRSQRYQISYWDGAIIAAAERLGATTLYTEDLNDGQTYGAVTAINPFKEN